jgi:hypothetical protein
VKITVRSVSQSWQLYYKIINIKYSFIILITGLGYNQAVPCQQTLTVMFLHVSRSLTHAISSDIDFLLCHFIKLSGMFSCCLFYLLFCLLLLDFLSFEKKFPFVPRSKFPLNFPFLKICLMNLDCFFLNFSILFFSLTCLGCPH